MSDKEVLADIEQYPTCEVVEFKSADLVGLKEAVDSRKTEQITVNNIAYWVQAVRFKFDLHHWQLVMWLENVHQV